MALLGNAYWASIEVKEFNVDEFIENVYQEFAGTEHEESREELMNLWNKVLSVTSPRGDASLYPNNNSKHRAAAMKVWHKAGDFWRAKYRQGDQLLCDQHGIALTKNDLASIARAKAGSGAENGPEAQGDATEAPVEVAIPAVPSRSREGIKESAPATPKPEPRPEPQQLDLFMMSHHPSVISHQPSAISHQPSAISHQLSPTPRPQRRRQRRSHQPSALRRQPSKAVAIEQPVPEPNATKNVLTVIGTMLGMSILLMILWQTGLIIPLGLIGLVISGFLK